MKTLKGKTRYWIFPFIILGLCLPLFLKGYYIYVINLLGIYILIAFGLNLLTGYCGQISIGHAAFLAMGAFASSVLTEKLGIPFWGALPLSGFIVAFVSFLVGIPVLRLRVIFLAIATIGLGIITNDVLYNLESISGAAKGVSLIKPSLGSFVFKNDEQFYYIILGVVILLTFLLLNITKSRIGRAFLAIRESERAASSVGINVSKYRMIAFMISAFYTGIAGSLYGHMIGYINISTFDITLSITFLVMIIIGGIASIPGSILGAAFVVLLPEALRDVPGAKEIQVFIYGALVIIFVIYLPGGLTQAPGKLKKVFRRIMYSG